MSDIGEKSYRTSTIWIAAILVVAAALRLVPIWFGIPYLPARPDEEVAVSIATLMTQGDLNPHFFH